MSDIEKAFEIIAKYTTSNRELIQFGIIIGLLAIAFISVLSSSQILVVGENESVSYINASEINTTGFANSAGNNVSCIREINGCYWNGSESTTPWILTIYFYNVTNFNYVETLDKYNSTLGVSTHEVIEEIWCVTINEFVAIRRFANEDDWFYGTKNIPSDSHFIMSNGTVIVRYNHMPSGNANHRFYLDVSRLIYVV